MKKQNWMHLDAQKEVRTENGDFVFSTLSLDCSESVIETVVSMHNAGNDSSEIDEYLMDCEDITQDDREIIVEEAFENYYSKLTN